MTEADVFGHNQAGQRSLALSIAALLAGILHFAIFFSANGSQANVKDEPVHRAVVINLVSLPDSASQIQAGATVPEVATQNDILSSTSSEKKVEANSDLPHARKIVAKAMPDKEKSGKKKQKLPDRSNSKPITNSGQTRQAQSVSESASAGVMQNHTGVTSDPVPFEQSLNRKPPYPEIARQRGQEGKVILLARIDRTGHLTGIDVIRSSGYLILDEAAVKAVRKWRFKPATRAGMAIEGTVAIPVDFRLR